MLFRSFTVPVEGVFNQHPDVARTALVPVKSPTGTIVPVLCVELAQRRSHLLRPREKKRITEELLELGAAHGRTRDIHHFLYLKSFPVDARHNSKIRREELAVWATAKLGRRISANAHLK